MLILEVIFFIAIMSVVIFVTLVLVGVYMKTQKDMLQMQFRNMDNLIGSFRIDEEVIDNIISARDKLNRNK